MFLLTIKGSVKSRGVVHDPYLLFYMGYKLDSKCTLICFPPELIQVIMSYGTLYGELFFVLTDSPHCLLEVSNNGKTCQNKVTGYRGQPFYSVEPLTHYRYIFRYIIDYAMPSTTMEIGVITSHMFEQYFTNQDTNCTNLKIRNEPGAFLFSWNAGTGSCYGNIAAGKLYAGYKPKEVIAIEVDMWKKTLNFYRSKTEKIDLSNLGDLLCSFSNLPDSVIPIAYLLGSGYDTKLTMIDFVRSLY